jgi:hypothetical protein
MSQREYGIGVRKKAKKEKCDVLIEKPHRIYNCVRTLA